ncbi:MAG: VCBS repeat-containing protein [Verrucomicrobiota bacterium]
MRRIFLSLWIVMVGILAADEPWARHTIDAADAEAGKRGADGVRLADANGDGLMDVTTGWEQGGAVRVCLHPGVDAVTKPWPSATVGSVKGVEDAVFADLDGDGALDVVSCAEGKVNSAFVHWAPPAAADYMDPAKWTTEAFPESEGLRWMFALPMDVNKDGKLDLVVGAKNKGAIVGWLENPAEPRKVADWKLHKMNDAGWVMSLRAADVDADGDDDIVLSDRYETGRGVYWLENPSWKSHMLGGKGRHVMFLDVGDLNGDDALDVICATLEGKLLVFLKTDDGWDESVMPLPFGLTAGKGVAIADVNLDGRPDIVTTSEAQREADDMVSVAWLEQTENGEWTEHRISDERGRKFDRLEMIDLDGDGDLDLMTCEEVHNLGVFWYENPLR